MNETNLLPRGCLDLNINTRRQTELIERFDRLGGRLYNINQTLVRSNLKLLPRLLVDMRAGQHRVPLDARWQRNRTMDFGVSSLGSVHDVQSTLIENPVIISLHPNPNDFVLTCHVDSPHRVALRAGLAPARPEHRLSILPILSPGVKISTKGNHRA